MRILSASAICWIMGPHPTSRVDGTLRISQSEISPSQAAGAAREAAQPGATE
jgi:hypothetical protein